MQKVTRSTTPNLLRQVPIPAGAVLVDDWFDTHTDAPFRYFEGSRRIVDRARSSADVDILVRGVQHHDGRVAREVVVHGLDANEPLTIGQARQLSEALTELVDEVEQMNGYDKAIAR